MGPQRVGHIAILLRRWSWLSREFLEGIFWDVGVDDGEVLLQVEYCVSNRSLAEILGGERRHVEDCFLLLILSHIRDFDMQHLRWNLDAPWNLQLANLLDAYTSYTF